MSDPLFTVAEANRMIPALEAAFDRLLQLRLQMRLTLDRLATLGFDPEELEAEIAIEADEELGELAGAFEIHRVALTPTERGHRMTLRLLVETLREELAALEDMGCLIRGLEPPLVDWLHEREGRQVLLCWRRGEREVRYFHELEGGFAGRRPLDELDRARSS